MKKITAIFITAIMMLTLAMPAFATDFVDSVTGQPAPGVEDVTIVDENDNVVEDKGKSGIRITPISEADTLPDEDRKELEDVFKGLSDGTMDLPEEVEDAFGDDAVVKDLFDVTPDEDVAAAMEDGNKVKFTLDAGVNPGEDVMVAAWVDGQWVMADKVVNNGDGTVTVTMSKLCPVAVFVKGAGAAQGDVGDGVCKICHGFFPYLGAAPLFDGVCIICFVLICAGLGTVAYGAGRYMKNKKDKK